MKTWRIYELLLLFVSVIFFVSVASASHTPTSAPMGSWKIDAAGKKHFEDAKVLPGYTYYYIGSIEQPDSVMALSNKYTLHESKFWAKVEDMSDKVLRGWLQGWKNDGHALSDLNGGVILDPKGKTAGFWHSHYRGGTVWMLENGELEVFQPYPIVGKPTSQTN